MSVIRRSGVGANLSFRAGGPVSEGTLVGREIEAHPAGQHGSGKEDKVHPAGHRPPGEVRGVGGVGVGEFNIFLILVAGRVVFNRPELNGGRAGLRLADQLRGLHAR